MQPGPKPKPVELKVLEGNPGKRPLPTNYPRPRPVAPRIPRGIPPAARRFWKENAPKLERLGILTEVDGPAFTLLVLHWTVAWQAGQELKNGSLLVPGMKGGLVKNPLLQILRDNSRAFRQYAAEFGLTPSARSRLSIPEPEEDDGFFGF